MRRNQRYVNVSKRCGRLTAHSPRRRTTEETAHAAESRTMSSENVRSTANEKEKEMSESTKKGQKQ